MPTNEELYEIVQYLNARVEELEGTILDLLTLLHEKQELESYHAELHERINAFVNQTFLGWDKKSGNS